MAITRLAPYGTSGENYGSFAGKPLGATTHPVGRLTQLAPYATSGELYGAFTGKPVATVKHAPYLPTFRPRRR